MGPMGFFQPAKTPTCAKEDQENCYTFTEAQKTKILQFMYSGG